MTTSTTPTVTIATAAELLQDCIAENIAPMLWGAPGIGKTEVVGQVAKSMGIGFRSFIASIKQPVDLSGIPVPDLKTREAIWLRPTDFPKEKRDGKRGIFFVDEINTCAPAMQAACFSLIEERRVGDHHLPDGWIPVGAGNRIGDRAAAQRMPTALKNRFSHFTVEPDVDAWAAWAAGAGIDPFLIAFLKFRKELLHMMPEGDENAFPTPRSWVKSGKFLNRPPERRQLLVAAQVGQGPAAELEAFLRVCHSLPSIKDILSDPTGAKAPTDPASKYAVSGLLCRSADRKNFATILEYAKRLGREFEILTAVDAVKRQPDLTNTNAFGAWAVANQDVRL